MPLRLMMISILLVMPLSGHCKADSTKADKPNIYTVNIGACAGLITGAGLSYRHWFPKGNGFQITLSPYYDVDKDPYYEKHIIVSGGVVGLRAIHLERAVNLYFYYGVHGFYFYNHDSHVIVGRKYNDTTGYYDYVYESKIRKYKNLYFGCGPGIDFNFWRLSLNLMVGIAGRLALPDDIGITPSLEAALYYTVPRKRRTRMK